MDLKGSKYVQTIGVLILIQFLLFCLKAAVTDDADTTRPMLVFLFILCAVILIILLPSGITWILRIKRKWKQKIIIQIPDTTRVPVSKLTENN